MYADTSFVCSKCDWLNGVHTSGYDFCCSHCGAAEYKSYNVRELWNKDDSLRTDEEKRVYEDALLSWVL